jgi:hypothetical protein
MFLVRSQRLCGTIECFAGSHHAQRKRAAAMPQPSLGRSVVDVCRPGFRVGTPAPKIVRASYRHLSRDRQGENGAQRRMFQIFPTCPSGSRRSDCRKAGSRCRVFPNRCAGQGTNASSAHCVGGWYQPSSTHCPDARRRRSVGRTGCILEQPVRLLTVSVHPDFHRDPDQVGVVLGP